MLHQTFIQSSVIAAAFAAKKVAWPVFWFSVYSRLIKLSLRQILIGLQTVIICIIL